jgi:hypothetical protein
MKQNWNCLFNYIASLLITKDNKYKVIGFRLWLQYSEDEPKNVYVPIKVTYKLEIVGTVVVYFDPFHVNTTPRYNRVCNGHMKYFMLACVLFVNHFIT